MPLNNRRSIIILFFLVVVTNFYSCKQKTDSENSGPEVTPIFQTEEFQTFYDQFGRDSAFQMNHIIFPLEGTRRPVDSLDQIPPDFRWQKDGWLIHRTYDDMDGTFTREMMDLSGIVIERISDQSGKYTMERRFGKLSSGWNLIYYRELGIY
ncbi:MAG: hypothetical protein H7X99_10490 [Saprospiraceae bacterium]|nr:hypothetical protein [Saprospiraceae bacterium]